jgi:hypothetical protein
MYHMEVFKTLRFFCVCCYLRMHDSHSNAFVFHLFIVHFKLNDLLNNSLVMFLKDELKNYN